jgi:redox-sensitive bicupin YhaK (pirin superfamily)
MTPTEPLFGNAVTAGHDHRGWIVGHFISLDSIRHTDQVEIKWGIHPAGDQREAWHDHEERTTILILIQGRFRIDLSTGSCILADPGDFAMWGPGIAHSWKAETDSTVLTVRWTPATEASATKPEAATP